MPEPHDWEADPRNVPEILAAWEAAHGWSGAEAARQLRVPYMTYRDWRTGRRSPPEGPIRRLMTLIDAATLRPENLENAWAALRMIREAVEAFGPAADLGSEEVTLKLYGPEPVHEAEAIVAALRRVLVSRQGPPTGRSAAAP